MGGTIIRSHHGYDRIGLAIWNKIHLKLSEPQNSTSACWYASCSSWAGPEELAKYLNWRIPLTHSINNVTDDDLTAAPALAAPQTKVPGGRVNVRERATRDGKGRMNLLCKERYILRIKYNRSPLLWAPPPTPKYVNLSRRTQRYLTRSITK